MGDDGDDNFTSITWESKDDAKAAAAGHGHGPPSGSAPSSSRLTSPPLLGSSNPSPVAAASPSHPPVSGVDLVLGTQNLVDPYSRPRLDADHGRPRWEGYLMVQVTEARKEHEGTKEMFVSYGIRAETNLKHFARGRIATRRRFQDFVFLRENLARDFPACVIAPLPDKHRLEYLTGDRFRNEFIERRVADLQLFLERVCRHPTLQRSQLLRSFLESTEWHVEMHTHTSSAASGSSSNATLNGVDEGPRGPQGILDTLSDTFLNAFAKVRKPDEQFEVMKERLDKFEEGLTGVERVVNRGRVRWTGPSALPPSFSPSTSSSPSPSAIRSRSSERASSPARGLFGLSGLTSASSATRRASTSFASASPKTQLLAPNLGLESQDLATDYEELASSIEGLGYLESGITDPLNHFAATSNEWAKITRNTTGRSTDELQSHLHAILAYSSAHRSVLKLRDQKQLDFEELTDYLSSVVSERDRLASLSSPYGGGHGHGGVRGAGITGFLRDKVDHFRGVDEERTRVERMQRLDGRIKELQDAVTVSHDVSVAFSDEVSKENKIFHMAKDQEMKDLLGSYADGQVAMWQQGAELWDALIPKLEAIKVDV